MDRYNKAVLAITCFLITVLYTLPFFLEKIARKHMMFYRYLVVKQYWWEGEMFYWRIVLTIATGTIIFCLLIALKRNKQSYLAPFYAVNIFSLIVAVIVVNIRPKLTLVHFCLLIAGGASVLISFLAMLAVRIKANRL